LLLFAAAGTTVSRRLAEPEQPPGADDDGFTTTTRTPGAKGWTAPCKTPIATTLATLAAAAGEPFHDGQPYAYTTEYGETGSRITPYDLALHFYRQALAALPADQHNATANLCGRFLELGLDHSYRVLSERFGPAARKGRTFPPGQGGKGQKAREAKRITQAKAMAAAKPRTPDETKLEAFYRRLSKDLAKAHGGQWKWKTVRRYLKAPEPAAPPAAK
jgi:hypothetical protein